MEDNMVKRHYLKFAAKGVAEQARIMRKLAKAARSRHYERHGNTTDCAEANLYDWRRKVTLAREARAINLIRGYLKGLTYEQVENSTRASTINPYSLLSSYLPRSEWETGVWTWLNTRTIPKASI